MKQNIDGKNESDGFGVITNDGRFRRGKLHGKFVRDVSDLQLKSSVGGFNASRNATRADREFLADELKRRSLRVPPGFIEGRWVHRRNDNDIPTAKDGMVNDRLPNENHNVKGEPVNGKKEHVTTQASENFGVIDCNTLYSSEAFRRCVSSRRGPMAADTLTDWVRNGLRVERGPDGRLWILGSWFCEWLQRGCRSDNDAEKDGDSMADDER